jgi:predicted permease
MLSDFYLRLRSLFRRKKVDAELDVELQFHVDQQTEKYMRAGMNREEALRQARMEFGGMEQIREECRESRGVTLMTTLGRDLHYALRMFARTPGFTLVIVVTLALGIGATTAIFSLFDQVLLRMLPVEKPGELVRLAWHGSYSGSMSAFGGDTGDYYSYPMYKDLRDRNQVFSGMLATMRTQVGVSWHNQAEDKDTEVVSGNYFEVLGLKPYVGRLFTEADETTKGANAVVVLSYDYWRTRFNASRDVIGQMVAINGNPFTIVGVAPENFHTAIGGYRPALFVPVTMADQAMPWGVPGNRLENRQNIWLTIVARLKPDVKAAQAEASLLPLWRALRASDLTLYKKASKSFKERFVAKSTIRVLDDSRGFSPNRIGLKTPLVILLSMAGLLMAMCTINVATLLLLRATARAREMSMRYALGAKSMHIVRQLLTEGGLLGIVGVAGGLAFSPVFAGGLVRLMTRSNPDSPAPYSSHLDAHLLLFAAGVGFAVSVLFSIAPALHYLHPDLGGAMRQNAGTASRRAQRFRKAAVGVQIALSVLLLGVAGLFVRTLDHLRSQAVGFDAHGIVTLGLDPSNSGYRDAATSAIVMRTLDALRRIPGVDSAAATTDPELEGDQEWNGFTVQGHTFQEGEATNFESPYITPGYFTTLKQPLLVGRDFTLADSQGAPKVAIVNLSFAKRFYGSAENALGRLVGNAEKPDTTIVGVVGVVKHENLRTDMTEGVYEPYLQETHATGVQFYIRATRDPELVMTSIRQTMHKLDPLLVVADLETMDSQVDISAADERTLAILTSGFAVLASLLAALGLYGVLAYSTQSRTREIGVRLALGAPRYTLLTMVVSEMGWIASVATLVALPGTVGLAHLFQSQLYGVKALDPQSLIIAVALTAAMVVLAAALPARRATSVDPVVALRCE